MDDVVKKIKEINQKHPENVVINYIIFPPIGGICKVDDASDFSKINDLTWKRRYLQAKSFGKTFDEELEKNTQNYTFHGSYRRGELPQLLREHQIDLVCLFPIWPETYSYTLTESYMAKIPVISFDIGAIAERLKRDKLRLGASCSELLLSKF